MSAPVATNSSATASTGAPAAAAGGAAFAGPHFNSGALVHNADLVLLVLAILFFLFALPKAVSRFTHRPEWWQGFFVHSAEVETAPMSSEPAFIVAPPSKAYMPNQDVYSEKVYDGSDEGHAPWGGNGYLQRNKSSGSAHADLLRNASTSSGRARRVDVDLPTHTPGWSSLVPWLARVMNLLVLPRITVGKALIVLIYTGLVFYIGLYKNNPFTGAVRAGWVVASQIPVVIVLGMKNSIPSMLIGVGYEQVSFHSNLQRPEYRNTHHLVNTA